MKWKVSAAIAALLLLSGCATTAVEQQSAPTATPTPTPSSTETSSTIPIISGDDAPEPPAPPVRVQVPSVGVDVSIQPVGILDTGLMELPADPKIAGWYKFGPAPASETGTTVIAAHVDSLRYGLGPFSKLKTLGAGAEIIVTTADGVDHRYALESLQNVRKAELPVAELFERDGSPRLTLITCGGQFDTGSRTYSDNVYLVAVPVA